MTLSFELALATVREKISAVAPRPPAETVALECARGRLLAEDVAADRDYPPFHRATRDGFAVRSQDLKSLPATLERVGEVRAGERFERPLGPGQAVEIMTGAPLPEGSDGVVMLEDAQVSGTSVRINRPLAAFENVVRRGSEAKAGSTVVHCGRRLGPGEVGLLAAVGWGRVKVFRRPRVAILPTGDEVVPIEQPPEPHQIRNSNAASLAAQVEAAGGSPWLVGIARDSKDHLRQLLERALEAELVVITGGVSMGKYDLVEPALEELGAQFYFQGAEIRPGKPVVFGKVRDKFFFGLPGNPVSTLVTFDLFARPAIGLLGGAESEPMAFLRAQLAKPLHHRTGLTMFLPARVTSKSGEAVVEPVAWQGSGDLIGLAAANCFLVVHPNQTALEPGEWMDVWPRTWG